VNTSPEPPGKGADRDTTMAVGRRWDLQRTTDALQRAGTLSSGSRVSAIKASPLGAGLLADTYRLQLDYDPPGAGPASMVAKSPSADPEAARTAERLGAYRRECTFYERLAPRLEVRTPRFYGTLDQATPLLEDLSAIAVPGDCWGRGDPGRLESARSELAAMQAPHWDDADFARLDWLHRRTGVPIPAQAERYVRSWSAVRDVFGPLLPSRGRRLIERFGEVCGQWAADLPGPRTLTHHDFRFGNMMFSGDRTWILDWQTVGWGVAMFDLAYLVGTSVDADRRRALERAVVLGHLGDLTDRGVPGLDEAWGWTEYRRLSMAILFVIVPAAGTVRSTEGGNRMLAQLLRRGVDQALDLDAEEFFPA